MFKHILLVSTLVFLPAASFGDEPQAGRYQLKEMGEGVVRLDTVTGALAFCKDDGGTPSCTGLESASHPAEADIKALEARVSTLEKQVAELKDNPTGLPSDEEVDRSLSIMQKFMRGFFGMVHEFERKNNEDRALPQRT